MTTERLVKLENGEKRLRELRDDLNWYKKELVEGLPEIAKVYMRQALTALEEAANNLGFAKESLPEYKKPTC